MDDNSLIQSGPDDILIGCVKIKSFALSARENSIIDISALGKLALAGQWLFQQKINVSTAWRQNGRRVARKYTFDSGLSGPRASAATHGV